MRLRLTVKKVQNWERAAPGQQVGWQRGHKRSLPAAGS